MSYTENTENGNIKKEVKVMLKQERLWIDMKKLRQERRWRQKDAAEKLGVNRSHLSAVENGKCSISPKMAMAIMRVYDVRLYDFIIKHE